MWINERWTAKSIENWFSEPIELWSDGLPVVFSLCKILQADYSSLSGVTFSHWFRDCIQSYEIWSSFNLIAIDWPAHIEIFPPSCYLFSWDRTYQAIQLSLYSTFETTDLKVGFTLEEDFDAYFYCHSNKRNAINALAFELDY